MAFPSSPGYTNLANGAFSPTIFSQRAIKEFRKVSVVEDVTNTDYFGEISNYGDTVKVIKEPDITVTAYTRGAQPTTQDLVDNEITLTVDKANMFQFAIDDIEMQHSHVNFEQLASNRAAYELKDAFDSEVLTFMGQSASYAGVGGTKNGAYLGSTWAGSVETLAAVLVNATVTTATAGYGTTKFNPAALFARAKREMDLKNIPAENRFFVGDPYFYEQLGAEDNKLLSADYAEKGILRNGRISDGLYRGFKLYESNNLPTFGTGITAADGSTNGGTLIFGHKSAVATVSQIAKSEKFRSQNRFADVVRGLHLYGRGVIRPEALYVVRYTVTD